jgi:hypothetical protein
MLDKLLQTMRNIEFPQCEPPAQGENVLPDFVRRKPHYQARDPLLPLSRYAATHDFQAQFPKAVVARAPIELESWVFTAAMPY